jgi:hypothetical protein
MKMRTVLLMLVLMFSLSFPVSATPENTSAAVAQVPEITQPEVKQNAPEDNQKEVVDDWQALAPGIDYREYHLSTPNNVFVARMTAYTSTLTNTLETSIALGKLSAGRETVRSMAGRYDQAINYAGGQWGARNDVVVAINGFYFDPYTGVPWSGLVHSGWYAKHFDDAESQLAFGWMMNRYPIIGEGVYTDHAKQIVKYVRANVTQNFDAINLLQQDDQLVLFTPQFDKDTPLFDPDEAAYNTVVEALIKLPVRPTLIIPDPNFVTGIVKEIFIDQGQTPIPFDHVVLSATGAAANILKNNLQVGDEVHFSQEVSTYPSKPKHDWTKTYAGIGGAFYFLKNGMIQSYSGNTGATARAPRTAIAYNESDLFFIVVDGRDPSWSVGMNMQELGAFARDTLGATDGVALDGGGSSTMVVKGEVKNNTFCNNVFCAPKVFLPLAFASQTVTQTQSLSTEEAHLIELTRQDEAGQLEVISAETSPNSRLTRQVADGMLMVAVEPFTQTMTLTADDFVTTTMPTEVRLGPGTNYEVLEFIPENETGVVLPHALNGVLAKDSNWWKVKFGALQGWVREETLLPVTPPTR